LFGGNEFLAGARIRWYVPNGSTMINYENTEYGLEPMESSKQGYTCYTKVLESDTGENQSTRSLEYKIKPLYNSSYTNNKIICEVAVDTMVYTAELPLTFISYGTNGTDYTLAVAPLLNN